MTSSLTDLFFNPIADYDTSSPVTLHRGWCLRGGGGEQENKGGVRTQLQASSTRPLSLSHSYSLMDLSTSSDLDIDSLIRASKSSKALCLSPVGGEGGRKEKS